MDEKISAFVTEWFSTHAVAIAGRMVTEGEITEFDAHDVANEATQNFLSTYGNYSWAELAPNPSGLAFTILRNTLLGLLKKTNPHWSAEDVSIEDHRDENQRNRDDIKEIIDFTLETIGEDVAYVPIIRTYIEEHGEVAATATRLGVEEKRVRDWLYSFYRRARKIARPEWAPVLAVWFADTDRIRAESNCDTTVFENYLKATLQLPQKFPIKLTKDTSINYREKSEQYSNHMIDCWAHTLTPFSCISRALVFFDRGVRGPREKATKLLREILMTHKFDSSHPLEQEAVAHYLNDDLDTFHFERAPSIQRKGHM